MKKAKRWSELNKEELAAATREFDDPMYEPVVRKPTAAGLAALRRVQRKSAQNRFRIALSLDRGLVEAVDDYAVREGTTFSAVVADALRELMKKRTA